MDNKKINLFEHLATFIITITALFMGEVTVFYMIWLFWWQELIRSIFCFFAAKKYKGYFPPTKFLLLSFLLLFFYAIFIIVFFGLQTGVPEKLVEFNLKIFLLLNPFFNLSILVFAMQFAFFIYHNRNAIAFSEYLGFNRSHIILHISIVLGVNIHFFVIKKYGTDFNDGNFWESVLTAMPFLLLTWFIHPSFKKIEGEISPGEIKCKKSTA
ncbi:MAG: hypothetical protein JST21_14925 [Bacteroidetes bacterium]|nr:hypothetical protein [Bacteroidota bacterium]